MPKRFKPREWDPNLSLSDGIRLLEKMLLIRIFEERANLLYQQGAIQGFLHLAIGQEALIAGAVDPLLEKDYLLATYREHGHILARGTDPRRVMAELCGKKTGINRGFGGSMHLADPQRNFLGGYAIVGSHLPIAVGVAYAIQYRGEDQCVLCFLGDGAVNIGAFHEGMNLAQLYKLPLVFVVENNFYAIGTREQTSHGLPDLSQRADGYGMRKRHIDGMDLIEVRQTLEEVLDLARRGKGPTFVVADTYRYRGHSATDPGLYRPRQEEEIWKERDPIERFKRRLRQEFQVEEELFSRIESRVRKIVDEAEAFALSSPFPEPAERFRYLYYDPQHLLED
jgi:pyruvate dehydrogenase E1 component alpha subunit